MVVPASALPINVGVLSFVMAIVPSKTLPVVSPAFISVGFFGSMPYSLSKTAMIVGAFGAKPTIFTASILPSLTLPASSTSL